MHNEKQTPDGAFDVLGRALIALDTERHLTPFDQPVTTVEIAIGKGPKWRRRAIGFDRGADLVREVLVELKDRTEAHPKGRLRVECRVDIVPGDAPTIGLREALAAYNDPVSAPAPVCPDPVHLVRRLPPKMRAAPFVAAWATGYLVAQATSPQTLAVVVLTAVILTILTRRRR